MEDKNELSDIVLDKKNASASNKKTILAIATLGVVLIIVVLLMKPGSSSDMQNDALTQPVPPKPQSLLSTNEQPQETVIESKEPLFEEVNVIEEEPEASHENLDAIAQKLKEESNTQRAYTEPKPLKQTTQKVAEKKHTLKKATQPVQKTFHSGHYYVQVGSFAKYEPNKKFLSSITKLGYKYKYHNVGKLNKVLVGPFPNRKEADKAKKILKAKVVKGAFVVKI